MSDVFQELNKTTKEIKYNNKNQKFRHQKTREMNPN